jgi:VWFA-related protein
MLHKIPRNKSRRGSIKLDVRSLRRLGAGLAICSLLLAQEQERSTFITTTEFVLAPVTVVDAKGQFVTGLTPLDFRLYDNGKLQEITEDVASHPVSLAVVIQSNAAVEKILPQIQKSASLYDSLVLGEGGEMTVIGFDGRPPQRLTQGFTSDPAKIKEAFQKLKPGSSGSRLNDAAMDGINQLRNRPKNFKRILMLISESRDNGSELRVRDVMDAVDFNGITVYSVDISHLLTSLTAKTEPNRPSATNIPTRSLPGGYVNTPTTDSQNDMGNWMPVIKEIYTATKAIFIQNPLEVFTKYSGGREYSFMTQRGLDQAVSDIGRELHSQYLLTYRPNNRTEAGFHEIVVQIALPDMKVRTRNGYWYAGKAE